jgi:VCBS repeat protein
MGVAAAPLDRSVAGVRRSTSQREGKLVGCRRLSKWTLVAATAATFAILPAAAGAANWIPAAGSPFASGVSEPRALAVGDLNRDGRLDTVVGNRGAAGPNISVLLGDGSGGLLPAGPPLETGAVPVSLAVADLDNDGNPDVVAAYSVPASPYNRGSVSLLLGNGIGGLTPAGAPLPIGNSARAMALGDFTGDGTPDAPVAHAIDDDIHHGLTIVGAVGTSEDGGLYRAFGPVDVARPRSASVADFNRDSKPDVAVGGIGSVSVFLGNGTGGVAAAAGCPFGCGNDGDSNGFGTGSVAVGDYNRDTNPDAAVGNSYARTATLLIGDGGGALQRLSPALSTGVFSPGAVAAADFNGDGALDVATADMQASKFAVLLGNGSGGLQFAESPIPTGGTGLAAGAPEALKAGDFNGDNRPDVVVANVNDRTVSVLLNEFAFPPGYARPRGATPIYLSLVPASLACTAPSSTHGEPLAFGSCTPPQQASSSLTVGGDGTPARSTGYFRVDVLTGIPGPPDDSDVQMKLDLRNVMWRSDRSDYTGEVRATSSIRLTDRSGGVAATTQDFSFGPVVPCVATADTTIAAECALTTTADSIMPGAIPEGERAIWALGQLKVYDGGPDGDAGTAGDNTLFETQGVFTP